MASVAKGKLTSAPHPMQCARTPCALSDRVRRRAPQVAQATMRRMAVVLGCGDMAWSSGIGADDDTKHGVAAPSVHPAPRTKSAAAVSCTVNTPDR